MYIDDLTSIASIITGINSSSQSSSASSSAVSGVSGHVSSAVSSSAGAKHVAGQFNPFVHPLFYFIIAVLLAAAIAVVVLKMIAEKKQAKQSENTISRTRSVHLFPATRRMNRMVDKAIQGFNVGNSQNIGKRENQQDAFALSNIGNSAICKSNGVFAVVADGMGGLQNGAEISGLVVSSMLSYFEQKDGLSPTQKLREMLTVSNEKVNQYLSAHGQMQSGSTVVAVLLYENALNWISVGDSRIYLFRDDRLWQLNQAHNLATELDEKALNGEITREEALNHKERNALTSYIGMGALELIDANIAPLALRSGDRILLCTDGVFGTVSDDELVEAMKYPASQAAEEIEKLVMQKNKKYQDNMTAVVIECL